MIRARLMIATCALLLAGSDVGHGQDAAPPSLNPLSTLDTAALPGFRERPLFAPSRRPPATPALVEATPVAPPPDAAQPNLRLTGVIESPEESIAVVRNLDANETWQLRLGDRVGGWLVTSIDPAGMRLTLGERDQHYRLFDAGR